MLKGTPPGKYGLLMGSLSDVNIQAPQAFLLHSGEAWRLHRCRTVIDTMRLTAAGEVHEPDQAGNHGDSWPGSRCEGVERGRKREGSFPHRPLIHTVPSVPNPIMACEGDDSEVGLADSEGLEALEPKGEKTGERIGEECSKQGAEGRV